MQISYRYELRRGEEIVATGHLLLERDLQVGDQITIAGRRGTIRSVDPEWASRETRLLVDLAA